MALRRPGARGFTLLEMLLVVTILGALAFTVTAFVDNQDDQARFEDSRARLAQLRRATLGDEAAHSAGIVAQYVADNGVLPAALSDLLAVTPTGYSARATLSPVLDATPDPASGHNDGSDEIALTGPAQQLVKGWRAGSLHAPPGIAGNFRDGWGFAFTVAAAGGGVSYTSLGKDNAVGGTDYNQDLAETVAAADWSAEVFPRTVRVRAEPGTDFVIAPPGVLRVSLLVFENADSGGHWKRYSTDGLGCLDGDGDGLVGGLPCASEATLTFPSGGYPGGAYTATRVPLGQHLLIAVTDADGLAHSADDALYPSVLDPVSRAVACAPGGCPIETLVLR